MMPHTQPSTLLCDTPVLKEILDTGVSHVNGQAHRVHSQISAALAEALYAAVLESRPAVVLEVGMAFGVSTLAILAALRALGPNGRLMSIDPDQSTYWHQAGIANVARAGLQKFHQVIEEPDFVALPKLLDSRQTLDFGYIDGWHTFDYTLLDFYYVDKMLTTNGIVGFNDCGYPAVHKVLNFVLAHRHYKELEVGLRPVYSRKAEVLRLLRGRWSRRHRVLHQDRYFSKVEQWEPTFDFHAEF